MKNCFLKNNNAETNSRKQNVKLMQGMVNMVKILMGIIVVLVGLSLLFLKCISTGKIKQYTDEKGNVLPNSLSEKIIVEINGAKNGFFINSKDVSNPVLLFISSGPGTDDYFFNEKYKDMKLDELFTVVYWDYRGMGIAYDKNIDPKEITLDVLMKDTKAVTQYLKERFDKEKIYVMGFSGGTKFGIRAVKENPEDYYAYIGMAQVVTDSPERDTLMYDFMKDIFEKRKDQKSIRQLESMVDSLPDGWKKCHNWYSYVYLLHEAGGGTTYNENEFWGIDMPIIMSHCYTITEKINYIKGMKMYRKTTFNDETDDYDYRDEINEFDVPVYFLSGEYDYNCPWPLVKDYYEKIKAPDKGFFLIKNAAHSPLWENAKDSCDIMKRIISNE